VSSWEKIGILSGLEDYLRVVGATGRIILTNKQGAICIKLPPILEKLSINRQQSLQSENLYAS
jgi:hypothetical protein